MLRFLTPLVRPNHCDLCAFGKTGWQRLGDGDGRCGPGNSQEAHSVMANVNLDASIFRPWPDVCRIPDNALVSHARHSHTTHNDLFSSIGICGYLDSPLRQEGLLMLRQPPTKGGLVPPHGPNRRHHRHCSAAAQIHANYKLYRSSVVGKLAGPN
jgi:hypothetical protein